MAGGGSGTRARQRARELLVKALYQWQVAAHDVDELVRQFAETKDYARADQQYFRQLLEIVVADVGSLDRSISLFAVRSIEQLDIVGRSILLLGLAELKYRHDVPTKVIINEAIELAKRYGAADSFRFVNAVLDKAARSDDYRPGVQNDRAGGDGASDAR